MDRAKRRRAALFALVCAVLVASALAFAADGPSVGETGRGHAGGRSLPALQAADLPGPARRAAARTQERAVDLRRSARRFLAAFLAYEVGELDRPVASTLRAGATAPFARRLLAMPPRAPAGKFPPPARLRRLHISFVSAAADRALLSGEAFRGASSEQFSFLFELRQGRWLARAPGQ
jgi:hypothetical protein